jgi:hypothetical protein
MLIVTCFSVCLVIQYIGNLVILLDFSAYYIVVGECICFFYYDYIMFACNMNIYIELCECLCVWLGEAGRES